MLVYTLKSVAVGFAVHCPHELIKLMGTGNETGKQYDIEIKNGLITIDKGSNELATFTPYEFELYAFEDKTVEVSVFERQTFKQGDKPYEYYKVFLDYPARLFIEYCRVLKMRAAFTIKYEDKYLDCYYISDRVRWREDDGESINVHGSDLYKLNTIFPGYEVVRVGSPHYRASFKRYMEISESMAETLGKPISKYDNGKLFM